MFKSCLRLLAGCTVSLTLLGCSPLSLFCPPSPPIPAVAPLGATERALCKRLGLDADAMALLESKPLYLLTESEVDLYLGFVHEAEPNLSDRVIRLARKNLGQPYKLHLLGEHPFELHDPAPLYSLSHGDCVVFSEHTYAMALSRDWATFFRLLQRIRYKDGVIGVVTRNHYTVADWDRNNDWLVRDATRELAGDAALPFRQNLNRGRFLRNRYKIDAPFPIVPIECAYVPWEAMHDVVGQLENGDFVNVVYGGGEQYASHVGLIARGPDGTANFLHSTPPRAVEEPILGYMRRLVNRNEGRKAKGQALFLGFKFLRLREDPMANLRAIDGPDAPRLSLAPAAKRIANEDQ